MSPNNEPDKSAIDLDLDSLDLPPSRTVKVNGRIIKVLPLRINDVIRLQKLEGVTDMEKVLETLKPFIPDITEANLTPGQLERLVLFLGESLVAKDVKKKAT